jgi:OOP family OmpA-OmpF porin
VTDPATPPPAAAPPREIFRLEGVFFDFDRSTIKPEGRVKLDSAVTILNRYADLRVEIQGHTDSIGTNGYNDGLSMRRANAVREYLTSRGIAASRLTTRGFGETTPIADNGTDAGRAQNRRDMLVEIRN